MVKLGVCLRRRKDTVMPSTLSDASVGLVGLEDIQDGGRGGVTIRATKPQEIESLKTRFVAGDILYGKLRPYLNKVGIAQQAGLCSTEIWAFGPSALVDSQFAAFFLASSFFVGRVASLTKGANLPRLDTEAFDSTEIPLPPLSEQQRIVEILQEAEAIRRLHAEAEAKTADLIPVIFSRHFGDLTGAHHQPLGALLDAIQTGWSPNALESPAKGYAWGVLKLSAISSGRYIGSENKELPTELEPDSTLELREGDVLLSRKNTRDLVGACVYVWETKNRLMFPDLVFRLIPKSEAPISSKYLWALLSSPSFSPRVRRLADGAAGSMPNIPKHRLEKLLIPIPDLERLRTFDEALLIAHRHELELWESRSKHDILAVALSAHAFSGQLTADWREAHTDKLALEVRERDAAFKQAGAIFSRARRATIREMENIFEQRTDGIYSDLNREQRHLLREINRMVADVPYARYFSAKKLGDYLSGGPLRRNPQLIEGHLAILAARGLIIPVSREEQTEDTGEFVFGNTYRLPLKDQEALLGDGQGNRIDIGAGQGLVVDRVVGDAARLRELARLADQLEKERALT